VGLKRADGLAKATPDEFQTDSANISPKPKSRH